MSGLLSLSVLAAVWLLALPVVADEVAEEAFGAPRDTATRSYRPSHRAAEELLPLARTALGEGGSAVVDPGSNSLVLAGRVSAVEAAVDVLRLHDRRRRTVIVFTETRRLAGLDSAGYRLEWSRPGGSLRVGRMRSPETVGPGAGRVLRSRRDEEISAALRILEGETGRIVTGRAVPLRTRGFFWDLFDRPAVVEAESGLEARPLLLPDGRVQLRLTPFRGDVDPRARASFDETATTVALRPGETIAVGALERRGDTRSHRVFSTVDSRETLSESVTLLRVEVE